MRHVLHFAYHCRRNTSKNIETKSGTAIAVLAVPVPPALIWQCIGLKLNLAKTKLASLCYFGY